MNKRLPYLAVVLLCILFTPSLRGAPPGQQSPTSQSNKKPSKHSGLPVVGEFQSKPESPEDHAHRLLREERYGKSPTLRSVRDPGLGGPAETTDLIFIDYVVTGKPQEPRGIPGVSATAIVIGTVVSGRAFATEAHNYVYTDYRIRVDEILKQDPAANLAVGGEVVAAREGGAIHFPSGHITNYITQGHGLPGIGSQYILFLQAIPDVSEYDIIFDAGYQLKDGRVYSLDDVNAEYDGLAAVIFLGRITKAVAGSQNGGKP
jgi:hypothetical protein